MTNGCEIQERLEEGLAELDKIEAFFEVRGLPVPVDARQSMEEKRARLTEQLERIKSADREE